MRYTTVAFLLLFIFTLNGQDKYVPNDKEVAYRQIQWLKNGAIVVRLKTNEKSVEAYRNAGKKELADKIELEHKIQNQKILSAFRRWFDFCPVYFIYAGSTNDLLKGKDGIFLDDTMGIDPKIHLKEKYFLIGEYGTVMSSTVVNESKYSSVNTTHEDASPASTSAIFLSDTTLTQLREPFPFYQVLYLDNYDKTVARFNTALTRFYNNVLYKKEKKKK